MDRVAEVEVDRETARVYEHGWQSWSPSTDYPVTGRGYRPISPESQVMGYRGGVDLPTNAFQGEGLLAVSPSPGTTHVFAATEPDLIPSIRATLTDSTLLVESTGPIAHQVIDQPLYPALSRWAPTFPAVPASIRPAPTVWCSWYQYYAQVTEADILENIDAIAHHQLPVDVIQIDDGWQSTIGDWLTLSPRFASLEGIAGTIRSAGHRPGIWIAPFIAGSTSRLVRDHPDWVLPAICDGFHQQVHPVDLSNEAARAHLVEVFTRLAEHFDYFKLDYLFAGAYSGLPAYRDTLTELRTAIADAYLVACGAPILPTVGLADAMRVGPDIAPHYEPPVDDMCSYSQRTATLTTVARRWQHGHFWVNDPDCLLARPEVERRESWSETIAHHGGLRATSDRIDELDPWGLETTHRLLRTVPPPTPFPDQAG